MDEHDILTRVRSIVDEEHELRARLGAGEVTGEQERARIRELEAALDQCWDLLRQRRARQEFGENPDDAAPRPASEVEGYRQ